MIQDRKLQDSTAIKIANKLAADFSEAWNSHEASSFADLWAEDADRIHICGDQVIGEEHGRTECVAFYEKIFSGQPNIAEKLEIESAHFLSAELILIDGKWSIQGFQGENSPNGRIVWIIRNENGGWSVVSCRVLYPSNFISENNR